MAVGRLHLRVGFSTCSSRTSPCFAVWVIKDQARALLLAADNCTLHSTYTGALFAHKFTALPEPNSSFGEVLSLPTV